jgi:hypothetical protein
MEKETAAFLAMNPYKVTPEFYAEYGTTAYFLDEFQPIPKRIPLLAGDAVHSLRTALDYLAYSLTPKPPGQVLNLIYFPISKSLKEYEAESARKTKGMPQEIKKRIDAFKPYGGGNDLLWELHHLDIVDKHRLLVTTATIVTKMGFEIDTDFVEAAFKGLLKLPPGAVPKQTINFPAPKPLFPLEKGALLYGIKGNFEVNERVNLTFDIAFGEPEVITSKPIVPALVELSNLVESIVLAFR